jgi:hypothetical protein
VGRLKEASLAQKNHLTQECLPQEELTGLNCAKEKGCGTELNNAANWAWF